MKEKFEPQTKVLAIEWYIPDGWYGSRKRVILTPSGESGFLNSKESKPFVSLFKKYVNDKFGVKETPEFKTISECPTYIYCGAGPSYSCSNIYITSSDLQAFKEKYERSEEFQEKKRKSEQRKFLKSIVANR